MNYQKNTIRTLKNTYMKLFIACLFLFFVSATALYAQHTLPKKRPADLIVTRSYNGGMVFRFSSLYISKDSCVYKEDIKGEKNMQRFTLSKKQLDELYASLIKNNADKIRLKASESIVYDRGGTIITISWEGNTKSIVINDAENNFIEDKWQKDWNALKEDINKLLKDKIKIK